jgi:hypothetical protein
MFNVPEAYKFLAPWAIINIPIDNPLLCGGVVYY